MTCTGLLTYSLTLRRDDAYQQRTRALRRTADLEQLRCFPLAPAATNNITLTLLARLFALCNVFFSAMYVANLSALIWLSLKKTPDSCFAHMLYTKMDR